MLKVFQYWDRGVTNMPAMIRHIYEHNLRLSQYYNFELILITEQTATDYITLMRGFGNLFSNHQSDVLRFFVLNKHGGIWLDCDAIILKDLNQFFNQFKATKFDMILDVEHTEKVGCAVVTAKSNTVCSNYCIQYLLKKRLKIMLSFVFKKPPKQSALLRTMLRVLFKITNIKSITFLEWAEIGPRTVRDLYLVHGERIKRNSVNTTKKGCNFITWVDDPGYDTSKWLLENKDAATTKANSIFSHTDYVLTWTIYRQNNFQTPIIDIVFNNELSVFHHLLKLANANMASKKQETDVSTPNKLNNDK